MQRLQGMVTSWLRAIQRQPWGWGPVRGTRCPAPRRAVLPGSCPASLPLAPDITPSVQSCFTCDELGSPRDVHCDAPPKASPSSAAAIAARRNQAVAIHGLVRLGSLGWQGGLSLQRADSPRAPQHAPTIHRRTHTTHARLAAAPPTSWWRSSCCCWLQPHHQRAPQPLRTPLGRPPTTRGLCALLSSQATTWLMRSTCSGVHGGCLVQQYSVLVGC